MIHKRILKPPYSAEYGKILLDKSVTFFGLHSHHSLQIRLNFVSVSCVSLRKVLKPEKREESREGKGEGE